MDKLDSIDQLNNLNVQIGDENILSAKDSKKIQDMIKNDDKKEKAKKSDKKSKKKNKDKKEKPESKKKN